MTAGDCRWIYRYKNKNITGTEQQGRRKTRFFPEFSAFFCFLWWLLPTCDFKARPYVVRDLQKHWFLPHVLMISANLANQWNPKHFHKMSEISQNTVFFHVFLVFSHSKCGVILSCYSGGPFFSHSKFGVSSFGNRSLILSSSPALYHS